MSDQPKPEEYQRAELDLWVDSPFDGDTRLGPDFVRGIRLNGMPLIQSKLEITADPGGPLVARITMNLGALRVHEFE